MAVQASEAPGPFQSSSPRPPLLTVGIWDLGARVGYLPRIIEAMNGVQDAFRFFEVMAAIPSGLVSQPEKVVAWVREQYPHLTRADRESIGIGMIDEEFFPRGEKVRKMTKVDYLCGLTPTVIIGRDANRKKPYWDLFTSTGEDPKTFLVSTFELRDFASKADRPFEMLVAWLMVAQLLGSIHRRRGLRFHPDTGCLFDFNNERTGIIESVKSPMIEPDCLKLIPPTHRKAAQALMGALATYGKE